MTILVRDEEDIIASNIEFHLSRGVDHFLVMDNNSEDKTKEILLYYQELGLITYLHQPADDYSQSEWVTEMARQAVDILKADWVINSDADEFWWPDAGSLRDVFTSIAPHEEGIMVDRNNFIPPKPGDTRPFAQAMTIRESRSLNTMGQPLPPKICHRGFSDITVAQGNHEAFRTGRPIASTKAPLNILHFPVRSFDQLSNKIAKGGAAYGRNTALGQEIGATWRKLYALQERGRLQDEFDALVLSDEEVAGGMNSGRLVRDERLRDALASISRLGSF